MLMLENMDILKCHFVYNSFGWKFKGFSRQTKSPCHQNMVWDVNMKTVRFIPLIVWFPLVQNLMFSYALSNQFSWFPFFYLVNVMHALLFSIISHSWNMTFPLLVKVSKLNHFWGWYSFWLNKLPCILLDLESELNFLFLDPTCYKTNFNTK